MKKLVSPTFSSFSTFPQRNLGPRDSFRKVEKVEKVGKPTFFKPSMSKMLKKLVFPTFSTFIVSSFLMENVERLGFRALIMENVDGLRFFNMLGGVLDWF